MRDRKGYLVMVAALLFGHASLDAFLHTPSSEELLGGMDGFRKIDW